MSKSILEQIARDMKLGTFPNKSEATLREEGRKEMSAREEIAGLIVKNIELQERIEALEAALREIKDYLGYVKNNDQPSAVMADNAHSAWKLARAALGKDAGK